MEYCVVDVLEEDGFADYSGLAHCAVYALVRRGAVVYIGKTKKPWARLGSHIRTNGKKVKWAGLYENKMLSGVPFDEIWVRSCMLRDLDRIEVEMIKKHRPKYNVANNPDAPKAGAPMPPEIRAMINELSAKAAPVGSQIINRRGL